jgi:hypothetical protein
MKPLEALCRYTKFREMYGPSIEENFRWFAKLDFSYILCVLNVA